MRRGATRPSREQQQQKSKAATPAWGGNSTAVAVNGTNGSSGGGGQWGGASRPKFLGVAEMQKILRETAGQLREAHERNERQLQVVRVRVVVGGTVIIPHRWLNARTEIRETGILVIRMK